MLAAESSGPLRIRPIEGSERGGSVIRAAFHNALRIMSQLNACELIAMV